MYTTTNNDDQQRPPHVATIDYFNACFLKSQFAFRGTTTVWINFVRDQSATRFIIPMHYSQASFSSIVVTKLALGFMSIVISAPAGAGGASTFYRR